MDHKGTILVYGGCPSCETSARMTLRRCGKLYPRDYGIKHITEVKNPELYKNNPELGQFTSAFVYNPSAGLFVNLKGVTLTEEVKSNIIKVIGVV